MTQDASFIQRLNEYQCGVNDGWTGHPFTCGNRDAPGHLQAGGDLGLLVATADGWRCPSCSYEQTFGTLEVTAAEERITVDPFLIALRGDLGLKTLRALQSFEHALLASDHPEVTRQSGERVKVVLSVMIDCLQRRREQLGLSDPL